MVKPDGTVTWGAAQAGATIWKYLQVVEITGDQIYKALDQQYDEKEALLLANGRGSSTPIRNQLMQQKKIHIRS